VRGSRVGALTAGRDPFDSRAVPEESALADNQVYYFEVGQGTWRGTFAFRVTSWAGFRRDRIGLVNRFLAVSMALFQKLLPKATIDSRIQSDPAEGVARNEVRIHRLGLTLYLLNEEYTLNADGSDVAVHARERFGPIPFLFRNEKRHPAVIHAGGLSSTYSMPLLGTAWTADYTVREDRRHIGGLLRCAWAEAIESMDKVQGP
jgi:hypothetical protein